MDSITSPLPASSHAAQAPIAGSTASDAPQRISLKADVQKGQPTLQLADHDIQTCSGITPVISMRPQALTSEQETIIAQALQANPLEIIWQGPLSGGLTNTNFTFGLKNDQTQRYVLRIPGIGTEEMIDRAAEEHHLSLIKQTGLDADTPHFDAVSGIKVTGFINGRTYTTQDTFKSRQKITPLLKRLHNLPVTEAKAFDFHGKLETYEALAKEHGVALPDSYPAARQHVLNQIHTAQGEHPHTADSLCHNDLVPDNLIEGERLYIIDWEYAGLNDPLFDLASCCEESNLSDVQCSAFLQEYFGRHATPAEWARFDSWRQGQHLLWTVWAKIKVHLGDHSLKEYGEGRYNSIRQPNP